MGAKTRLCEPVLGGFGGMARGGCLECAPFCQGASQRSFFPPGLADIPRENEARVESLAIHSGEELDLSIPLVYTPLNGEIGRAHV